MPGRRRGLNIARASARVRTDAWDDLWPAVLQFADLPSSKAEINSMRRRLALIRRTGKMGIARVGLLPKSNGLMRPAHILSTDQRLYYQALIDSFMHDLDMHLTARSHVFGYRTIGGRSSKAPFGYGLAQWKRFRAQLRRIVASGAYGAMVRTDLTAFYERIPHGPLEERLTSLGVDPALARETRSALKALMGKAHGLPQGPDPSGVLASAYLYPMDQAVITAGYGYVRYVDDIVLFAHDRTDAKRGLRLLEQEARRLDLMVQSAKTELVVGTDALAAAVDGDDEIAGIDYVVRLARKSRAVARAHAGWISVARRKNPSTRLIKYLLNRLADSRDPVAIRWCQRHLGEADHLASTISRYLALFARRPSVQLAITAHLVSRENTAEWEEMNLLRALLTADRVVRPALDRARRVAADRNNGMEVRQYALILLGKLGNASDHEFVERQAADHEQIATAALVALQGVDARTRGRAYADIAARYPGLRPLAARLRSRSVPQWPAFRAT